MRRIFKPWLPVLLWMGVIFAMSTGLGSMEHTSLIVEPLLRWLNPHITAEGLAQAHFLVRKCAHFTEYALLAFLTQRAVARSLYPEGGGNLLKVAGVTLVLIMAYAATDEFHQLFVEGRGPSLHDVMIDTLGGFTALAVPLLWRKTTERAAVAAG
ncbi:MAG TPA: VanZ family protein [Candidatus Didemnitutus sp.]|nr:VanZ family protein [Candidatus Didemnitutus sp.]